MAGIKAILRNLRSEMREVEGEAEDAMKEIAHEILREAKERVPVDTGNLKSSGEVRQSTSGEYTVVFTAEYAMDQHENLTYHHDNGEAKFLENAIQVVINSNMVETIMQRHVDL